MSIFLSPGSEERPILKFEAENVSNYTALLLSADGETLYVGAREALFALSSSLSFLPGGEYQEVSPGQGWLDRAGGGWTCRWERA
jgi:plexin B